MSPQGKRGRAVAAGAGALCLAALAAAGFAARRSLLEAWSLWRLDAPSVEVRTAAAELLGDIGTAKSFARILDVFERESRRSPSFSGFRRVLFPKPEDPEAAATREKMREFSRSLRHALTEIARREGPEVLPALLDGLRSPSWDIRCLCISIAGGLGDGGRDAVPLLAGMIRHRQSGGYPVPEEVQNLLIVEALGTIGPGARSALPEIEKLLGYPSAHVMTAARKALEAIRGE